MTPLPEDMMICSNVISRGPALVRHLTILVSHLSLFSPAAADKASTKTFRSAAARGGALSNTIDL